MCSIICGSPAWTFGQPQPCAGASVLVYTVCPATKQVLLVLGQDAFGKQLWSDFGGGSKKETDLQCAARELAEETHGIFPAITEKRLQTLPKLVFHFPHTNNLRRMMHYSMFMDRIPFSAVNRLSETFAAAFLALPDETRTQYHVAEKSEIRIVPLADVSSLPLRTFFRTRLEHATAFLQGSVCFLRKSIFLRGYYRRAIARRAAREGKDLCHLQDMDLDRGQVHVDREQGQANDCEQAQGPELGQDNDCEQGQDNECEQGQDNDPEYQQEQEQDQSQPEDRSRPEDHGCNETRDQWRQAQDRSQAKGHDQWRHTGHVRRPVNRDRAPARNVHASVRARWPQEEAACKRTVQRDTVCHRICADTRTCAIPRTYTHLQLTRAPTPVQRAQIPCT
jgi:hypothetical protein